MYTFMKKEYKKIYIYESNYQVDLLVQVPVLFSNFEQETRSGWR